MVHYILTEKYHKPPGEKVSIYDLIEQEASDEEIEKLDPRKVDYD
tara:strand:+ start:274 stop:408 length:135 start_codon:yes stop_codon:yes gene_type:complete